MWWAGWLAGWLLGCWAGDAGVEERFGDEEEEEKAVRGEEKYIFKVGAQEVKEQTLLCGSEAQLAVSVGRSRARWRISPAAALPLSHQRMRALIDSPNCPQR